MLEALQLPPGVELVRTTPPFDESSVPAGLLETHRVAAGMWGLLRVIDGSVVFVLEDSGEHRRVDAGGHQVIEPEVAHHVELGPGAVFEVEFHR